MVSIIQQDNKLTIFRRFVWVTLIFVYLLVMIAGFVRSSGSGMGCPDWPLCFGKLVPPISESQLPHDYQTVYAHRGYQDTQFNAFKTWTEYINRLFGVLTGFASISLFIYSLRVRKVSFKYPLLSFLVLFFVCMQGGLGALVVFSNLAPFMVTVHMGVAIIIVLLLTYLLESINSLVQVHEYSRDKSTLCKFKQLFLICFVVLFFQVFLGTQVRESVDVVWKVLGGQQRHLWLQSVGFHLDVHKTLGLVLLFLISLFSYRIYSFYKEARRLIVLLVGVAFAEFIFGISLLIFHLPKLIQPLHLGFAFLIIGILFQIALRLGFFSLRTTQSRVK